MNASTLPRIVFMGTPPFAVASLNALVEAGVPVAAVVTAPDRPAGRGQKPRMSAVKERALELDLPILQPEKLKDPDFHAALDATGATLYVVVAFRMLPVAVWDRPALGTINLHASLLPAYRGAAPINWAVINNETVTGATTFRLQHAIDTGDILLQESLPIGPEEDAGSVHDRLMHTGAQLLARTVAGLGNGSIVAQPQRYDPNNAPPHAPKLNPTNCRIDPTAGVRRTHGLVRGLSPVPGAWAMWSEEGKADKHFKVLRAAIHSDRIERAVGAVWNVGEDLLLQCSDGILSLEEIQPEGKRRMAAADLVRGQRGSVSAQLA